MRTAEDFIAFIETIPEKDLKDGIGYDTSKTCIGGHISKCTTTIAMLENEVVGRYAKLPGLARNDFYVINDNSGGEYSELGNTAKERVLNALTLVACGLWKTASTKEE